jgi:Ca2+-binding RTX toxin-like protein
MTGGAGDDTYVVDDAGDTVTELAGAANGNDTVRTSLASYTLGANVEQLVYTGAGSFTGTGNDRTNVLTGGALGDTLKGMAGADTLNGGGGDDSLDGGTGIDTMYGGAGDDTYMVDDSADQVIEVAGEGTADTVRSSAMSYTLGADV